MQLVLIFLAASLLCGKSFAQIKPVLRQLGGEEASAALKQAEELSDMLSAVVSPQSDGGVVSANDDVQNAERVCPDGQQAPLNAIASFADERILTALSKYVATGE